MFTHTHTLQDGAPKIAKLAYNSNNYGLWMFIVLITIVMGVYKPTYNWGAPHCRKLRRNGGLERQQSEKHRQKDKNQQQKIAGWWFGTFGLFFHHI